MSTWKLTDGDLDLSTGKPITLTGVEAVRQTLEVRYRFPKGDWFFNPLEGVPYFQSILGKRNPVLASNILLEVATTCPGVKQITDFVSEFNSTTRRLSVSFKASVISGGTIDFNVDFVVGD